MTEIKDRHFNVQFIDLQFQMMSSRSWKQHLNEFPSNDDENKKLNSFHEASNSDHPTRDRIKNIRDDKDDVVACVDGRKKFQLIHIISNLEGTRPRSKEKIVGIIGM